MLTPDVRWGEPYASASLNRKMAGVLQPGICWGYEVAPAGGMMVRVWPGDDPDYPESVAVVDRDGYSVTVRQSGEDVVDLSGRLGVVHIVLEAAYQPDADTVARILAVSVPAGHHIVLARVTMPTGVAAIKADMIDFEPRTLGQPAVLAMSYANSLMQVLAGYAHVQASMRDLEQRVGRQPTPAEIGAVNVGRAILTRAPLYGGGDLSRDRALGIMVATLADLLAYQTTGGVITDEVLAAACKLCIAANATIHVATTGSDTTGDGSEAAPYASIKQALASIANKVISVGAMVTIQVEDGTYTVSSPIILNHPDGDKIQILGNTSAETALTIAAIDTTARTFTVAGDATALLSVGDYCRITTGTAANCGAYSVASVASDGTNTVVGVNEAIASATVGGASLWVMPANRVRLSVSAGVTAFSLSNGSRLGLLSGLTLVGGTTGMGVYTAYGASAAMQNIILVGFGNAAYAINSGQSINKCVFYNNAAPVRSSAMSYISVTTTGIASSTGVALWADNGGFIRFIYSGLCNCYNSNVVVPAFGVTGNNNAFISNS